MQWSSSLLHIFNQLLPISFITQFNMKNAVQLNKSACWKGWTSIIEKSFLIQDKTYLQERETPRTKAERLSQGKLEGLSAFHRWVSKHVTCSYLLMLVNYTAMNYCDGRGSISVELFWCLGECWVYRKLTHGVKDIQCTALQSTESNLLLKSGLYT